MSREEFPPAPPLVSHFAQLAHLKMVGMKAFLYAVETSSNWLVPHTLSIFRVLVESALSPPPQSVVRETVPPPVTIKVESEHPYANSMDEYTPICIPGAKRLIVTFEEETRTENGCDYMIFYTDSSHTSTVPGTEQYTGGKDGSRSNWPGLKGRPPVVIDSDSFEIYFHSDSSVNDWGYRMSITGEFGDAGDTTSSATLPGHCKLRGEGMNAPTASFYCYHLQQYLLDDRPSSMPVATSVAELGTVYDVSEYQGFESKPAPSHGSLFVNAAPFDAQLLKAVASATAAAARTAAAPAGIATVSVMSDAKEELSGVALIEEKLSKVSTASGSSVVAVGASKSGSGGSDALDGQTGTSSPSIAESSATARQQASAWPMGFAVSVDNLPLFECIEDGHAHYASVAVAQKSAMFPLCRCLTRMKTVCCCCCSRSSNNKNNCSAAICLESSW